jgi:hypothetical protein
MSRYLLALFAAMTLLPFASQAQDPLWRRNLMGGLVGVPSSYRDIERFEGYLTAAMPYCGSLGAADYGAYRNMVGQWTGYLSTMNAAARDAQTRAAVVRAWRSVALFPCAFPGGQPRPPEAPVPPPQPAPPPFSLQPPVVDNVSAADKETAADLRQRYALDAGRAAGIWNNAEILKISLGLRGMSVNADTAAATARWQLLFDQAAAALREHNWDEARLKLQGVEATSQKVGNAVGQ